VSRVALKEMDQMDRIEEKVEEEDKNPVRWLVGETLNTLSTEFFPTYGDSVQCSVNRLKSDKIRAMVVNASRHGDEMYPN
jgi:hypothetical protein